MVGNYVRKSNREAGYSKETLTIAVELVKSGSLTSYRASKIYKIPKTTLAGHVKGRRGKLSSSYGRRTDFTPEEETSQADCIRCLEKWGFGLSSYGRRTDFTPEEETSQADCIRCLEKWGFGLTRKEVIQIVAD
ncbi:CENP-B N-terminal DNA-binding domain [Popillia japonica]|uniref:CENP-B N-terminal DNA-binding domain n=1 Tax=Popillia japonica TaxID=7064 RepID=A0AAW1ITN6_POPJA